MLDQATEAVGHAARHGKADVAASPLMSWAARNNSSRVVTLMPTVATLRRAWSSRSHSASIHEENSLAISARAASARATGSSAAASALAGVTLATAFFSLCGGR